MAGEIVDVVVVFGRFNGMQAARSGEPAAVAT